MEKLGYAYDRLTSHLLNINVINKDGAKDQAGAGFFDAEVRRPGWVVDVYLKRVFPVHYCINGQEFVIGLLNHASVYEPFFKRISMRRALDPQGGMGHENPSNRSCECKRK